MITNLKKVTIIIALLTYGVIRCDAGNDSTFTQTLQNIQLLEAANSWLETGNSAGLVFNNTNHIVLLQGGMNYAHGDFHRMREPGGFNDYFFTTKSYQSLNNKRWFLAGNFTYHYIDENESVWNGTYNPYRGNPYIVADSVSGSSYNKESYNMSGSIACKINPEFSVGSAINYFVATGAKQKDPRPKNTVSDISINPSLIWHKKTFNLGMNVGYRHRTEEIKYIKYITDNQDPVLFMFKGFGFYSYDIGGNLTRFILMKEIFGGAQIETKFFKMPSLTEIRIKRSLEEIEDGTSSIKKEDGGDWKTLQLGIDHLISLNSKNSFHKIRTTFDYFTGDGIEYLQEEDKNEPYKYITISKNLKFNRKTLSGKIKYDYRKMRNTNQINWIISGEIGLKNKKEKYYVIPEILSSSYTNLISQAGIQKNFYFNKLKLFPHLDIAYIQNLSSSIFLAEEDEITTKRYLNLYRKDFNYYTSNAIGLKGGISFALYTRTTKKIEEIHFSINGKYNAQIDKSSDFNMISATVGMVF
jgi:hypothetical protein